MSNTQLFISYDNANTSFAHRLAGDLRRLGVQVWIAPESIRPGESWVDGIERGLQESTHMLVVLTPAAVVSQWVKKEVNVGIARERQEKMKVIPLEVEACNVPLFLSTYQMVSFRSDYADGLNQLAGVLGIQGAQMPEAQAPGKAEPGQAPSVMRSSRARRGLLYLLGIGAAIVVVVALVIAASGLGGGSAMQTPASNATGRPEVTSPSARTNPPSAMDLSQWVTIHDTRDETLAAQAAVTAMEISLARQEKPQRLSARYVYEKAKLHDEITQSPGTFLTTIAYVIEQFGAPPETAWPYQPSVRDLPQGTTWADLDAKAAATRARTYRLASYDEIPQQLALGRPVVAAYNLYEGSLDAAETARSGQVVTPTQPHKLLGQGVITIVGFNPADRSIRFANAWGPGWGDHGFGTMSEPVARELLQLDQMWAVEVPVNTQN